MSFVSTNSNGERVVTLPSNYQRVVDTTNRASEHLAQNANYANLVIRPPGQGIGGRKSKSNKKAHSRRRKISKKSQTKRRK